jgi:hypothetical protein
VARVSTGKNRQTGQQQQQQQQQKQRSKNPMSDDEEPNIFYRDARDGLLTSAADKQRKALKHFNYFLKGYCTQIGIEAVEAENIPYSGIPPGTSYKSISEWWDSCIGAFVTYMGSHAKSGCNPKGQHLSRTTADGRQMFGKQRSHA